MADHAGAGRCKGSKLWTKTIGSLAALRFNRILVTLQRAEITLHSDKPSSIAMRSQLILNNLFRLTQVPHLLPDNLFN